MGKVVDIVDSVERIVESDVAPTSSNAGREIGWIKWKTEPNNVDLLPTNMSNREETYAKVKALLEQRENVMRESWVKAMEARLVQDELGKCQKAEGVNHYESCKWLADKYLNMLKENRLKGYRRIDM